MFNNITQH